VKSFGVAFYLFRLSCLTGPFRLKDYQTTVPCMTLWTDGITRLLKPADAVCAIDLQNMLTDGLMLYNWQYCGLGYDDEREMLWLCSLHGEWISVLHCVRSRFR